MMVDTGSFADILYLGAYDKLGLPRKLLKLACTSLTRFTGQSSYPVGIAELDFTVGEAPRTVTVGASFTMVEISDHPYNGLIGRPLINALRAVISYLHLKMKFPTSEGIGEILGDRKRTRVCYQLSVPRGMSLKEPPKQKRPRENRSSVMKMTGENPETN
ncbi:hypothetical protein LIER_24702 [Lithospermum erythrorhizon]|uniref:Uncharacterized protein n=1 Tax=Lithospermum erythrorhizon TaxID=34254 RepID=A0AAV3R5G0_LITER